MEVDWSKTRKTGGRRDNIYLGVNSSPRLKNIRKGEGRGDPWSKPEPNVTCFGSKEREGEEEAKAGSLHSQSSLENSKEKEPARERKRLGSLKTTRRRAK